MSATPATRTGPHAPSFSVIVPAYNAARYIGEALACVRDQTCGDWECLVVDDGSTDDTAQIVQRFTTDPRFRMLAIEHGASPGRARNHGIRAARGRYVAFLDADDLWTADKLARYRDHLAATDAALVFSNGFAVDEHGRRISELLSRRMQSRFPVGHPLILMTNIVPVASVVMRRDIATADPFAEEPLIRGAEDYLLWLHVNSSHELHYLSEPLLLYRCHTEQMHRDPLAQLEKWERILDESAITRTLDPSSVALTRELIDLRRLYFRRELRAGVRQAIGIIRWCFTDQRSALLTYVRFGLSKRVSTMVNQRRKRSLVGV